MNENEENQNMEQSPEIGKSYIVQCDGYKCVAVIEKDGRWKSVFTGNELRSVINVVDRC